MTTARRESLEAMKALEAEHVEVRALLSRASAALEGGGGNEAARVLLAGAELIGPGLDEHIRVEDEDLFPIVADELGQDLVDVFSEEHLKIRELRDATLASLAGPPLAGPPLAEAAYRELCELLESHTVREDQMLFPAAREALGS